MKESYTEVFACVQSAFKVTRAASPDTSPRTHVLRLHLGYDGDQPTIRLRHKVFSAKFITWDELKEMVKIGTVESSSERTRVDWMYSRKFMKHSGSVQSAPDHLQRCAVIFESFLGSRIVSTNLKVFAIDLLSAPTSADSTWLLDLQRSLLEPEPRSYDELTTRQAEQLGKS